MTENSACVFSDHGIVDEGQQAAHPGANSCQSDVISLSCRAAGCRQAAEPVSRRAAGGPLRTPLHDRPRRLWTSSTGVCISQGAFDCVFDWWLWRCIYNWVLKKGAFTVISYFSALTRECETIRMKVKRYLMHSLCAEDHLWITKATLFEKIDSGVRPAQSAFRWSRAVLYH